MYNIITSVLSFWALIGFFGFAACPINLIRRRPLLSVIASGPIGWLYFIPISIWIKLRKGTTVQGVKNENISAV